jgi:hypothetical protein
LHLEEDLKDAPEIVEGDRCELDILPDIEPVQIAKRGDLGVPGSAANFVSVLEEQFGQVSAVLP